MNAEDLEHLRLNLDSLKDVDVKDIALELVILGVLDTEDKDKLAINSNVNHLYELLKEKHPKKEAYKYFLEALRNRGSYESSIADKIEATKTLSDSAVVSKVNPSQYEDKAREILNNHYTNKLGAQTSLDELRDTLNKADVFSGGSAWTDKQLFAFVHLLFADVQRDEDFPNYLKNVGKIETLQAANAIGRTELPDKSLGFSIDFTSEQLRAYLQVRFEKEKMASGILYEFEKQDINGSVFLTLTEKDLKEIIPDITFGMKRKLHVIIEELNHCLKSGMKPHQEVLREFKNDISPGEFYTLGRLVDVTVYVGGQKTRPIKNFHLAEYQCASETCKYIALQVVQFAAACMNTRRDGTLYFGISPEATVKHKAGEIVGMKIPHKQLEEELNQALKCSFHSNQLKTVLDVMRPMQNVPVKSHHKGESCCESDKQVSVIEYDFISSSTFLNEGTIHVDPKSFPDLWRKYKLASCTFTFSEEGKPRVMDFEEEHNFDTEKKRVIAQRETEEKMKSETESPSLRERLLHLITGGKQILEDGVFPFLILGPISPEQENNFQEEDLLFLKHLHPEVVFDFNEEGSQSKMYCHLDLYDNFRVLITDDFDTDKSSKEEVQKLCQDLACEKHRRWIFCNGDQPNEMKPFNATQWNKQRKRAFQVALNSQIDIFKRDRILLIICLFSHSDGAVVQASDEVLSHLSDQWLLLTQSKRVAESWQRIILQRDKVEKDDLTGRCVVGLSWKQVSDCFQDCSPSTVDFNKFQITHSNGSYIEVTEKMIKSWCDVELVAVTDPIYFDEDEKNINEVQLHFYRGGQVQWLNFWASGQVLERSIHQHLKKDVEKLLGGNEKQSDGRIISSVYLYHQPGAGGTTVAKQVLWDLRKEYRCCLVLDITDQTCDQLEAIYLLKDDNPKPLLLLIDNMEDEKVNQLKNQLISTGRRIQSRLEGASDIFCVLLICIRCMSFPLNKHKTYHNFLRQELDPKERISFDQRYNFLEAKCQKNKTHHDHPRYLISFNLMKENFNKESLRPVVEEFANEIREEREVRIMKFVSLLNTFDPAFTAIPVSCFDLLLGRKMIFQNTDYSYGKFSRRLNWEANVSPSFKILLNLSSSKTQNESGSRTVKVFHKLLAEEILETLKRKYDETVHGIILQLLQSRLFEECDKDVKIIEQVIWRVIIGRQRKKDGTSKKEPFSDLILYIKETEGIGKAVEILDTFYKAKHNHPIIAQHICRFYLDLRKYEEAECYGDFATQGDPRNSSIWNSYGQVFLSKLNHEIEEKQSEHPPTFRNDELTKLFYFYQEAVTKFRQSQMCAELERKSDYKKYNTAGYFDELRSIDTMLKALEMCICFSQKQVLHTFLVDQIFVPYTVMFFKPEEINCLKSMISQSCEVIQILEDEFLSSKCEDKGNGFDQNELNASKNSLFTLKCKLDEHFGESQTFVQNEWQLDAKQLCEFRYRRAISKMPLTLRSLLKLPDTEMVRLEENFHLILKNVRSQFCKFLDFKIMLDMFTVIFVRTTHAPLPDLHYIQNCSHKLCFNLKQPNSKVIYLEKFFYFVLFSFPVEDGTVSSTIMHDLISAEENLKKAFSKKYPHAENKMFTEKPLFFYGHQYSVNFPYFVHNQVLRRQIKAGIHLNEVWKLPQVSQILKKFTGTLQKGGCVVKLFINTRENNRLPIDIQTLYPERNKLMWHKTVSFYIGLSFAGLKAVGIMPFS